MADSLIEFVSKQLAAENFATVCIIWDGDSYSDDSFTALIPRIYNSLYKTRRKIHLIAFVQNEDKYDTKKSFLETWNKKNNNMPISLYTTKNFGDYGGNNNDDPFALLGQHALNKTGAKHIVCFGGGNCLKKEYELGKEDGRTHCKWYVYPAMRYHEKKKKWETASLVDHFATESNVIIMK